MKLRQLLLVAEVNKIGLTEQKYEPLQSLNNDNVTKGELAHFMQSWGHSDFFVVKTLSS